MKIEVVSGNIAEKKADALITAINSGGMWFGGIDRVIQRVSGDYFHSQARAQAPLSDGQTVVATGDHIFGDCFANVVFVIDDLERQLREVVLAGLRAAEEAGFTSVTLPTIRMGVMIGVVEKSLEEAICEMQAGVRTFINSHPANIQRITFVVYNNPLTMSALDDAMRGI